MKRFALRLALIAIPAITLGASTDIASIQIAIPGDLREPSPVPLAATDWFAVTKSGNQFHLVSTRVEVQKVPDPCSDFYTRVVALGVTDAIFLVRGSSHFRAGPLDTVFHGQRFFSPSENASYKLQNGAWFAFQAYGSAKPGQGGVRLTEYQIILRQGRDEQVIVDLPIIDMDKPPSLQWAGDMDRDGKLDAIFDLSTHYASTSYVLFLSSSAGAGSLVSAVANLHMPGC